MGVGTPRYYATHPITFDVAEREGAEPALNVGTRTLVVAFLGDKQPNVGDLAIAHGVGSRWVATKRKGIGRTGPHPSIPGCVCRDIPATLHVAVSGPCQNIFKACTLEWGATPPEFSDFEIGPNCFLSSDAFVDDFSSLSYRYILGCDGVSFTLSRLFLPSTVTTAFRDSSDYQWTIGLVGNVCSPFLLSNGTIYQGGNPVCKVIITA
jgi:hypothetical protein